MLRSMYSGISGMKVNQTKLDVIGNNIANVNTTSFKSSRATFADLLSQNSSSAQAASATRGGVNAKQVGLGVQLSSIDRIMKKGSMQSTSRELDLGIDGNGYFLVSKGPAVTADGGIEVSHSNGSHSINEATLASSGASISYTRDGSFTVDDKGNLLTTDGYRILGYSLTNDDNKQLATAKAASSVTIGSLGFSFGAGTQLNGYKIQLGAIGPNTPATADVDTGKKRITINGDFSEKSNLTSEQIEKAISTALNSEGISQSVKVTGKPTPISNIASDESIGGSDAEAPSDVTVFGYSISFETGDDLNGYSIVIGEISSDDGLKATLDSSQKTITLSGDFLNTHYKGAAIANAINSELDAKKINVKVKGCTGNVPPGLSALNANVNSVTTPALNKVSYGTNTDILGYKVEFTEFGSDLNGFQLVFENNTNASVNGSVGVSGQTITLTADFANAKIEDLNKTIKNKLSGLGYKASFEIKTGSYNKNSGKTASFGNEGVSSSTPKVELAQLTFTLPSTADLYNLAGGNSNYIDKLKNLSFQITSINSDNESAVLNGNCIEIKGNFTASNSVSASNLAAQISSQLSKYLAGDESLASSLKVIGSGSNKEFSNTKSSKIDGGTKLAAGSPMEAMGLKFQPTKTSGAALNEYSIKLGNIASGTKTSVDIDKNTHTITINGDFVNEGAVTVDGLQSVLSKKLKDTFGQDVNITVSGGNDQILNLSGSTESTEINGGTSVQSIAADGTINFVSASTKVFAYDTSLKALKIPESVMTADGTEVAVESYSISLNGIITATLENGSIAALGQIALASFSNPAGLTSVGGNIYEVSSNSGSATIMSGIRTTGDDNSSAYGPMLSGYLEMSNVDLAEQFTDMITTTKAFQGSAKMITTGDEILTEIINLKR